MREHGMTDHDTAVRLEASSFLAEQQRIHGDILNRDLLAKGFTYQGARVPLVAPQGIFKPRILDLPLTITTVPPSESKVRPYDDEISPDGSMLYCYRDADPTHRDNLGLHMCLKHQLPLIYLHGVVPSRYFPIFPVYVVGADDANLRFSVMVDDQSAMSVDSKLLPNDADARRRYVTSLTSQRLHQHSFRECVVLAYEDRCSICRLHHRELLDAAHILPDSHDKGDPVVPNGLSLCKIHHAAYDGNLIGIRPDAVIEMREDILDEEDGPMLKYGIKAFHGKKIQLPRNDKLKPDVERLEERYELFRSSA